MNTFKTLSTLTSLAVLVACGDGTPDPSGQTDTPEEKAPCVYSHNPDSTIVKWTAFKTTAKVGVSGVFDQIEVSDVSPASEMVDVFKSAAFKIPVSGINSKDPARDEKITEHFFGVMANTEDLSGVVKSISNEKALVEISMNGVSNSASMDVAVVENKISLSGTINMADWNANASVDSLNAVCYDLHKGEDGESKLWSEVQLEISTVVSSTGCD